MMRLKYYGVLGVALLVVNCANYKLLQPEPLLTPEERGYVEIKDKKKDFELKKEGKHFITFPAPTDNNFYLVMDVPNKKKYGSTLTPQLIKKKAAGKKIDDEFAQVDTMSVYPIDKSSAFYYWLIDNGKEDVVLKMKYRYSPQWRFKFENKHAEFNEILVKNRVERETYNGIGQTTNLKGLNFTATIEKVTKHTDALNQVLKQLLAIESIFPQSIVNSTDEAYLNYKKLKSQLDDEIAFQNSYVAALEFFNKEQKTQGNPAAFIGYVEDFIKYFAEKQRHPASVIKESQRVLGERLGEIIPFYDQRLSGKDDSEPFDRELYMLKEFYRIGALYDTAGVQKPQQFVQLATFVEAFDKKSEAVASGRDGLKKIFAAIKELPGMPGDAFFVDVVKKAEAIQQGLPQPLQNQGKYDAYKCAVALNNAIEVLSKEAGERLGHFRDAEILVPQVNVFKNQQDYKGMLYLLKPKMHLDFLMEKYKEIDKLSIQQQDRQVKDALVNYQWNKAESGLNELFRDANFLNPAESFPIRDRVSRDLEDSLYIIVDRVSRFRVKKFCEENFETLENVDSLYSDSVFLPAHNITFSTGSKNELIQRKNDLIEHLGKMKENEFPAQAIKLLYEKFLKDPNDNGVLRGRAVVAHGEHYKGDDEKTQRRVAECNPWLAKWITEPKEYRRVFALPVTDNQRGSNRYVVRFNVRIETDAKFPVYDVSIKLPKELAKNAATEQWYEKIMLNKTVLKNEGRFTITAPTAENNYECQIGPMQVQKEGNNFLDIYFNHNSFKVFPISVMAQKPIIKKN